MELIALYVHPQDSKHLRSHSRAIMALDHSRLGLENKFLENKSGPIFLRLTGLLYKFLPTNLGVCNQPFILFIHHIWGEIVLFIMQTSDRMRYFKIFQDKLHFVNIQDDQSCGFSETVKKNFQNHPYGQLVLISSASCQCGWVFEWALKELRFNIITSLFLLFFVI